ncbi:hypothetical protein KPY62_02015 [Psychrobacter sp. TAE2020]|uniref:hypothetical protein n=1 Tax=Psychrobacter sp. TAE2020 TaxID=2846762 RepID=UPI001C0FD308|nr:hypothetical protein [Psychrobacter sp. TAE2020]MBU5615897.1 hypothetical protein [Psychrobacter sp. TAE2020]
MATLYQLHSTMDTLRSCTSEMALTWQDGDSIILLGSTVAFVAWLTAYLDDADIVDIKAIYALADDVAQLSSDTAVRLNLDSKLTAILTDSEWVALTLGDYADSQPFDKVVTIAL